MQNAIRRFIDCIRIPVRNDFAVEQTVAEQIQNLNDSLTKQMRLVYEMICSQLNTVLRCVVTAKKANGIPLIDCCIA